MVAPALHLSAPMRQCARCCLAGVFALGSAAAVAAEAEPATSEEPPPPLEGFVLPVERLAAPRPIVSDFNRGLEDWRVFERSENRTHRLAHERLADGNGRLLIEDARATPVAAALDLVIVFDGTGSMAGQINHVRAAAEAIVQALRKHGEVRLGLVRYTDETAEGKNGLQPYPITSDFEAFFVPPADRIWHVSAGGDPPEDELWGLEAALTMEWRADPAVARAIIVISDAPAKLGPDGRDFKDRTIDSTVAAARNRGIRIFPILVEHEKNVSDQPLRRSQAEALAGPTGGRTLSLEDTSSAVDAIIDVTRNLAQRSRGHPRYWRAPVKFLDNQSRYFATCLSYRAASVASGAGFLAPDVVLSGRMHTLVFHGFLDPIDEQPAGDTPAPRRIPLDERAGWVHEASNAPATRAELVATLSSLRSLLIRVDYREQTEHATLDDVILGDTGELTDVAVDEPMREMLERQVQLFRTVRSWREQSLSAAAFETALRAELQRRGHTPPVDIPQRAEALARLYREPAGQSFIDVMYGPPLRFHEIEIGRLRRAGSFRNMDPLDQLTGIRMTELFARVEKLVRNSTTETAADLVSASADLIILARDSAPADRAEHERLVAEAEAKRQHAVDIIAGWRASSIAEPVKKLIASFNGRMPMYDEIYR